jgi:hypothetical protein
MLRGRQWDAQGNRIKGDIGVRVTWKDNRKNFVNNFFINISDAAYKASNNKYVARIPDGSEVNAIAASETYKDAYTTFARENFDNGKTRFWISSIRRYMCRVTRGTYEYIEAVANPTNMAKCEFVVNDSGSNRVTIRADNNAYLCIIRIGSIDFIMAHRRNSCYFQQEMLGNSGDHTYV